MAEQRPPQDRAAAQPPPPSPSIISRPAAPAAHQPDPSKTLLLPAAVWDGWNIPGPLLPHRAVGSVWGPDTQQDHV